MKQAGSWGVPIFICIPVYFGFDDTWTPPSSPFSTILSFFPTWIFTHQNPFFPINFVSSWVNGRSQIGKGYFGPYSRFSAKFHSFPTAVMTTPAVICSTDKGHTLEHYMLFRTPSVLQSVCSFWDESYLGTANGISTHWGWSALKPAFQNSHSDFYRHLPEVWWAYTFFFVFSHTHKLRPNQFHFWNIWNRVSVMHKMPLLLRSAVWRK